jgi:Kef-type K+ transport system membrane component KefB
MRLKSTEERTGRGEPIVAGESPAYMAAAHTTPASTDVAESASTSVGQQPTHSGSFVLSARAVGVGSAITAVASLAALAIVASLKDADTLSTVALALAVLAFAIQIVVFIAQASTASQQMVRAEQLNKETSGILVVVISLLAVAALAWVGAEAHLLRRRSPLV